VQSTQALLSTDTNGINRFKPTDTNGINRNESSSKYENDVLYEQLPDLVNDQYRAWFCKHFYRLGREKVLQLASVARADGHDPAKYFCRLLKQS
jgi:membrane-bound lytic murein transglycosylase MltF